MKTKIKEIIHAYQLDIAGLKKEKEIAATLEHHAHCIVCSEQIKLIEGFISDLSKLIV